MKRTSILILGLILIILFSFAFSFVLCRITDICYKEKDMFNKEKELIAVEKAIRSSIGWAKDKDLNLLYSVIANDSNYTEIQPGNKVVRGIDQFKESEAFFMDDNFKALKYEIWDLRINFSKDGMVAWWYCMLNDINTWKGRPANWENVRWTGVLEKRDGNWVICQMHFSNAK